MGSHTELSGPDLKTGIAESELGAEPLVGHADGEAVLLVRDGQRVRAVGANCTHYGAPLADGIIAGGEVRCPWHHACFDLATGRPQGPAITPLPCWDVVLENGRIRVGARREVAPQPVQGPQHVVIIGAGAAGVACAETLRLEGHRGSITIVSAEASDPVDRPNLSKDILAGSAPEDWAFLRTKDAIGANDIAVVEGTATKIDMVGRRVLVGERALPWDALLVATGAEPVRLPIDGAQLPHVHTLRTLADTRAIARATAKGTPVVIIGASFIGLEAAASLRSRGADVVVVAPESMPLARVLGDEVGAFIRTVHEEKGVRFCLGRKPTSITSDYVVLDDGTKLPAAVVVMGVGVRPRIELASDAGLQIDRGVVVDGELRAAPGVWAAGDIARYPWAGGLVRSEHWQVAVRHGQNVARAMLGQQTSQAVPFFWTQHHDVTLAYVGHTERFGTPEVRGELSARNAHVVYREDGMIRAVMTVGRDRLALEVEAAMERRAQDELEALVR
ncbi:MAG TPA: FAD-dependent oxidoreductase [Kofleriaceae bacterium]|nr:FAD-dependent oxidoreductase [Kofleriaceae bacterium]